MYCNLDHCSSEFYQLLLTILPIDYDNFMSYTTHITSITCRTLVSAAGQDLLTPFKVVPQVGTYESFLLFIGRFLSRCTTETNSTLKLIIQDTFCYENTSGVLAITDFLYHMTALGWYTFLARNWGPVLAERSKTLPRGDARYRMNRLVESWKFGSGLDYDDHQ